MIGGEENKEEEGGGIVGGEHMISKHRKNWIR
jgi:hypothetical protein